VEPVVEGMPYHCYSTCVNLEGERVEDGHHKGDLACPHGVQFDDIVGDAARSKRAAWSYESPGASKKQVDHWIGFWEDVEID
jgi:uncharacterized protein (DUF427 family)